MLKKLTIAAVAAAAGIVATQGTAMAAPVNLAGITAAKSGSDLIQIRAGGRSGGGARHAHRHHHHHHHHRHWRHYGGVYLTGSYAPDCSFYYWKWKHTGRGYWRSKYYECID
jgi:UDP-N-acetylmuramyl pentapeptide phosphotransferase/UDP-N-acetylglucosamine-1-phosphate transferase